jgi:hypothetical protein
MHLDDLLWNDGFTKIKEMEERVVVQSKITRRKEAHFMITLVVSLRD